MEKKKKSKAGRVNKYNNVVLPHLELIKAWARQGMLEKDIAKKLGIGVSTLSLYKIKYSEFLAALKNNEAIANAEVENAFYKRCIGYEYEEITKENRDGELIETKRVTKQVYPDTEAGKVWLFNRMGTRWRNVQSINIDGKMTQTNTIDITALTALSADELRKLAAQAESKPKIIDIPPPDRDTEKVTDTDNDYQ